MIAHSPQGGRAVFELAVSAPVFVALPGALCGRHRQGVSQFLRGLVARVHGKTLCPSGQEVKP